MRREIVVKWLRNAVAFAGLAYFSHAVPVVGEMNVRMREGFSHGYVVLRDGSGKIIAAGENIQQIKGKKIESRLVFRFKDGSIDDDATVATQEGQFHLVSDHHIQKGPSFPKALDLTIDTPSQQVRYVQDGNKETESEHIDLPNELSNGILFTLIRDIKATNSEMEVPYLVVASKPRLIKLAITSDGSDVFRVGGVPHKAARYLIRVKLGGLPGAVAPLVGKQPADLHVWISSGPSPVVLRADGSLFEGGPVWSLRLASPEW